jgi:hypothetical protein
MNVAAKLKIKRTRSIKMLAGAFCLFLDLLLILLLNTEDGSSMLLRNVSEHLPNFTESHSKTLFFKEEMLGCVFLT